jgi:hypothetical protein
MRYTSAMRNFALLLTLTLFTAVSAQAADEALPPPQHDTHATGSSATAPAPETESKPNLNKELSPGEGQANVEVRSYTRKDGAEVSEYAVKGKVYMIKVQPPGGLPAYYLYDDNGDGNFQRRLPGGYKPLNPPVWVLKRF